MAQQNPITGSFGAVAAADAAGVHVAGLNKSFGANHVLRGIDLDVAPGEVVCLIGPSGSGKSTLLRCVNLLEKPDSGVVTVGEFTVTDEDVDLDVLRRHVGMVFQQFNLFPHLSVLENCTVSQVKVLKRSKEEAKRIALANLERVGLEAKAGQRPTQLSGGQQHRAAIARALSMDPDLMLFDEPTSALDPETVGDVLAIMRQLANDGMTMLVVTHEMGFARKAGDRVVFMADGAILEDTDPDTFFTNPRHERAQDFLGKILAH